jgi:predicted RNA-binding Zn ribbon-like protein
MSTVHISDLPRLGGVLCLDFVNTVDPRFGPKRIEYLPDYGALLAWGVCAGALKPPDVDALRRTAAAAPATADAVLARAWVLRDSLYSLLRPESRGSAEALQLFNAELRRTMRFATLVEVDGRYEAGWATERELDRILWSVVRSAAELAISPSLAKVHECGGRDCGWLFLDTSKAGRRRWCSMAICGNRAKSERHRERLAARSSAGRRE